jgi:hypothetical protein
MHVEETQDQAVVQVPARDGIPMPIVTLNRAALFGGIAIGLALRQPLWTTTLFVILLPAALFGRRASLFYLLGRILLAKWIPASEREDPRLMRFNNSLSAALLGAAQIAFLLRAWMLGWVLAGMVALAAGLALAGFCVGCLLYYQLKLRRYRLLGR